VTFHSINNNMSTPRMSDLVVHLCCCTSG